MQGNSTTPHASHDELLLARLYGGDVDERERARALDLVAACEECAGFVADLGAIATAIAAMAVPPRPRDFTLTEADAARLRRRSDGGSLLGWFGWTRALGGSMAAIGLVGVVALGAISAFGTSSATAPQSDRGTELTALGQPTSQAAPAYPAGSPTPAPESNGSVAQTVGATAATSMAGPSVPPPVTTAAPASLKAAGSPAATSAAADTTQDGSGYGPTGQTADGHGGDSPAPASSENAFSSNGTAGGPGSGGPDVRPIALAGSVGLLALGLLFLAAPRLAALRARR